MKLLCINNKLIETETQLCYGYDLTEDDVYTTRGKIFKDNAGNLCYYIDGLGEKLACRFTELLEENTAEKAIEKLKEEFQLN